MKDKTNVMRILDRDNIQYKSYYYGDTDAVSGEEVADFLKLDKSQMFKTLVTIGKSGENYVFLVPVSSELNLKKAANTIGEKSIQMIKSKDLLGLTGYIHGGCSPIGMKKPLKTIIDESAKNFDTIIFNGGKIGYQVEIRLEDLGKIIEFQLANIA